MKKKIIVGNWKMNSGFEQCDEWFVDFVEKCEKDENIVRSREIVICPPVILIDNMTANLMDYSLNKAESRLRDQNRSIEEIKEDELTDLIMNERYFVMGAQNCHFEENGAFTGDVSASMVEEVGCEYVILGHSERRSRHNESDDIIAQKVRRAHEHKLIPILCVGESKEVRDQNQHVEFVYKQLLNSIPKDLKFNKFVIAYEPIWSIGTGQTPNISQIKEMSALIRKVCNEKIADISDEFSILYGGSVSSKNSQEILSADNVDGVLVGGASLKADEFFEIIRG